MILGATLLGPAGCGSDTPSGGGSAGSAGTTDTAAGGEPASGGTTGGSAVVGGGQSGAAGSTAAGASAGGTAGGSPAGGAPASGGTAAGGSSSGGTSTAAGGNGGAGTLDCVSDRDCTPLGLLCDGAIRRCVACIKNLDCTTAGDGCRNHACRPIVSCQNSDECASGSGDRTVCDPTLKECVVCSGTADCPTNNDCIDHQCVPFTPCSSALNCPSGGSPTAACDAVLGRCVACAENRDCGSGEQCIANVCRQPCSQSTNCTTPYTCNTTAGYCVWCQPNESVCSSHGVAVCDATGAAFNAPSLCGAGSSCVAQGSSASCSAGGAGSGGASAGGAGASGGQGGVSQGGGPAGGAGGGSSVCSATFDPCSTIPHFTGTQTVDGQGADLSDLPCFEFRLSNAKFAKDSQGVTPVSSLSALTVRAVVRLGWSSAGIHMFAQVYDSAVHGPPQNPTELWSGDSIELMIAADAPTSATVQGGGPPDNDGPYQAIFSGAMGSESAAASYQNEGLPTEVEYRSSSTDYGYVVEVLIPWSSADAVAVGQTMGFNFGINDAETTDNQRDYYGAYAYVCSGEYGSCQEPYNNAQTWCTPTAG